MKRREFVGKTLAAFLAAFVPLSSRALQTGQYENFAELVETRGSDGHDMVLAAIDALGGMGRFVQPGQRVLLKPTMCFAAGPDQNRNTHPDFLIPVIRLCQKAGAAHVYVLDYSIDEWRSVYKMSGLEDAVKTTGNKPLPGAGDDFFPFSGICSTIDGKDFRFHRQVEQCDVIINLVKAGIDSVGTLMNGRNNLSGILWERGCEHGKHLEDKMLEVLTKYRPVLTLIEATTVVDLSHQVEKKLDCLLASVDPIAADVCLDEILGMDCHTSTYYSKAKNLNIGEPNLLKVSRQKIFL